MGTSFTTAHIQNAQNLTKAQFKKAFTDMMKAKGYTASDEENAALTYTLAFSLDRKWVTVLTDSTDTLREGYVKEYGGDCLISHNKKYENIKLNE